MEDGIFNESGDDHDFRIESEDNINMFTLDGANNAIGINNTSSALSSVFITPESAIMDGLVVDVRLGAASGAPTITNNTSDAIVGFSSNDELYGGAWIVNSTTLGGSGYGTATMGYGALGTNIGYGDYRVGVYGDLSYPLTGTGSATAANQRTAGVFGSNSQFDGTGISSNTTWGALGYNNSGTTRYGGYFYNYRVGVDHIDGNGKLNLTTNDQTNAVGIGVIGDYMSGAMRGRKYGLSTSGKEFAIYIDGTAYSNKHYIQLNKSNNATQMVPTYASSSTTLDVTTKGRAALNNGAVRIDFVKDYKHLNIKENEIIITVTPLGQSNGLYITDIDKTGFTVKENANGNSNVSFNWIAIATLKQTSESIPEELLTNAFKNELNRILPEEDDGKTLKKKALKREKE